MYYVAGTIGGLILLALGLTGICAAVTGSRAEARRKALARLVDLEQREYRPRVPHTDATYIRQGLTHNADALANVRDGLREEASR